MSTEVQNKNANTRTPGSVSTGPKRGGIILTSLILVAAVANLNLAVANVALPTIGRAFNASQTSLNLVAVGYSLGLAASVLWLGALGDRYGRKMMLIIGYVFCLLGFLTMLLVWQEGIPYWEVGLAYAFIGVGLGFAGTPASHSLTGSVPVQRVGMASGTADLQRDLGGAFMQSIFGALLSVGYAAAFASAIAAAPNRQLITSSVQAALQKSFGSATDIAKQYPQYASQITAAAKTSFLAGDQWVYLAGIVVILLGAVLVFFLFPKLDEEKKLLAEYQAEDTDVAA